MTPEPITIGGEILATEAAQIMRDADIGLLPVVQNGALVGVITDRDLVLESLAENQDLPIVDIMTIDPITVSPDDSADDVLRIMTEKQIRRLVVCDTGRVVGIVSVGDLAVEGSTSAAGEVMQETGPQD